MLWAKTLHLLFVIAWMAGLFYLPRILVHYREGLDAGEDVRRLVIMADRLHRFTVIMALPAFGFGAVLWLYYGITGAWLYAKLGLVALLLGYQLLTWHYVRRMAQGEGLPSSLFFRLYNEAALLLLIPILLLAVFKPWL
ncbi:MAG: CopD family protein [Pseudomonadales bacterium]